jgi:serine phosphatase RsbU (regulator of sigma subunit)
MVTSSICSQLPFQLSKVLFSSSRCSPLATDGYHDQFGGPGNKKFKGKQLKELLVSIAEKPMGEQRELLNSTFESWKGSCEQIDDVTILGMRI